MNFSHFAGWMVLVAAASSAGLIALVAATSLAGSLPPSSAKPLSEALAAVEAAGYGNITDVDFERGRWQIEATQDNSPVEISVDPKSLQVTYEGSDDHRDRLPVEAKPLIEIVRQIEAAGYLAISEIDLDGGRCEVETTRGGVRKEVTVDVPTGKIVAEEVR